MELLTREYFETHGYEKGVLTIEATDYWKAILCKRYESGDDIYIDIAVTNLMYKERFHIIGHLNGEIYIDGFVYTVEDLMNLYKLAHMRYNEKTNKFERVNDIPYVNKDIKV